MRYNAIKLIKVSEVDNQIIEDHVDANEKID